MLLILFFFQSADYLVTQIFLKNSLNHAFRLSAIVFMSDIQQLKIEENCSKDNHKHISWLPSVIHLKLLLYHGFSSVA